MYWRVRKISPEQLLKQFGVHIILGISLLLNFGLFVSRPKKETVTKEQKQDFANFAKQVTTHLLDSSYINYMDSTAQLQGELFPALSQKLRQDGVLPANDEDLKARLMESNKARRVCAISFRSINMKELDSRGMQPVDVQGVVAVHSADESTQQPFHFVYTIAMKKTEPPTPIIYEMQEVATQAPEAQPPQEQ